MITILAVLAFSGAMAFASIARTRSAQVRLLLRDGPDPILERARAAEIEASRKLIASQVDALTLTCLARPVAPSVSRLRYVAKVRGPGGSEALDALLTSPGQWLVGDPLGISFLHVTVDLSASSTSEREQSYPMKTLVFRQTSEAGQSHQTLLALASEEVQGRSQPDWWTQAEPNPFDGDARVQLSMANQWGEWVCEPLPSAALRRVLLQQPNRGW